MPIQNQPIETYSSIQSLLHYQQIAHKKDSSQLFRVELAQGYEPVTINLGTLTNVCETYLSSNPGKEIGSMDTDTFVLLLYRRTEQPGEKFKLTVCDYVQILASYEETTKPPCRQLVNCFFPKENYVEVSLGAYSVQLHRTTFNEIMGEYFESHPKVSADLNFLAQELMSRTEKVGESFQNQVYRFLDEKGLHIYGM